MVLSFDLRHGAKKTRSFGPPLAKLWQNIFQYTSIYFTKSWFPLVSYQQDQKINDMHWYIPGLWTELDWTPELPARNPLKKCFFQKMWFFGDLDSPLVILVNKPLKALCLSSKMVYQHLLYLLSLWTYWHLKITQGPTHFFNGNFRGCQMANLASGLQWAGTAVIIYPIQIFIYGKIVDLNLFCCNWICCANNRRICVNWNMSVLRNVLFFSKNWYLQ